VTDVLDGLVITAALTLEGRAVTYTPASGTAAEVQGYYTPVPAGQDEFGLPLSVPRLEVRASDLSDASITPGKEGDTVTMVVRGSTRTYRVTDVYPGDHGTLMLTLGERS
jgi:hypothetical protein